MQQELSMIWVKRITIVLSCVSYTTLNEKGMLPCNCKARSFFSFSFFFLVFEIGSRYVAESGHELPILLLHLLSTRMTAVYHHTWLRSACFLQSWKEEPCKVPVEVDAYHPFHRCLLQVCHLGFWGAQMKEELRLIFSEDSSTFKAAPFELARCRVKFWGSVICGKKSMSLGSWAAGMLVKC